MDYIDYCDLMSRELYEHILVHKDGPELLDWLYSTYEAWESKATYKQYKQMEAGRKTAEANQARRRENEKRYLEEAEHEFFRSLGFSIMQRMDDRSVISWPRVAASCSFEAPAFYADVLDVRLADLQIGTRSLSLFWEVYRDDKRLCRGEVKTVCCAFRPGEKMTSIDIPSEVREKLADYSNDSETG